MFCSNCGKEISSNSKFCRYCGSENRYFQESIESELDVFGDSDINTKSKDDFNVNSTEESVDVKSAVEIKNTSKEISYFTKHWRGELPLGISYWINNVFLNLIFMAVIAILSQSTESSANPIVLFIFVIGIWLFVLLATPWILVGLWRSSENHTKKYNKTFWASIVKLLVIFGWMQFVIIFVESGVPQIIEWSKIVSNNDSVPVYTLKISNNGKELELSGGIRFGLTDDVEEYFQQYPDIKILHLNSEGGRLTEAHKLSRFLSSRDITTYTSTGCYSACTDVFISGKYRLINKNAQLGFHKPAFPGLSESDLEESTQKERQFFLDRGVSNDFLDKAFSTPHTDMWKPSSFELLQAGVIHDVVDGSKFSSSDLSSWSDIKKVESDLLSLEVYQTIKTYNPKEFKKIVDVINNSIRLGETKEEMFSKTRKILQELFLKKIAYSSDELIVEYVELAIEEYGILYKRDPSICYDYAMGNANFNPNDYFSSQLIQKELDLINRVIISASTMPHHIPDELQIENAQNALYSTLLDEFGANLLLLEKVNPNQSEKRIISKILIVMFREMVRMEDPSRVDLLRFTLKT